MTSAHVQPGSYTRASRGQVLTAPAPAGPAKAAPAPDGLAPDGLAPDGLAPDGLAPADPGRGAPAPPPVPGSVAGRAAGPAPPLLVRRLAGGLPIRICAPDGTVAGAGGPGAPVLEIHDEEAFYRRLGSGSAGLAEAYLAGDWESGDLAGLFTVLAAHLPGLLPAPLRALRRMYVPRQPAAERATIDGARSNIRRHYDLSNEFFALFLDSTMTYSSALFAPGDDLASAQRRKNQALLDLTGTGPGSRVLEIGTGWGELAIEAAHRGAEVTSLTLSPAQRALASERIAAAGLAGRAEVHLCDYREATGSYDVVLSVEMIEAVGADYWPAYMRALDRLLAPGGRAGLQAITMPHEQMLATRGGHTWIHKYIFPGGQIPSLRAITDTLAGHTSLRVSSDLAMGPHYARTLREWRARFAAASGDAGRLGFGETFQRMWNLYLAYSEGGFRSGYLDVHQLLLDRPG